MRWFTPRASALLLVLPAVLLGGCKPAGNVQPDAGDALPDACNDKSEGLLQAECALALGGAATLGYISVPGDQDWYRIDLPAGLTGRSQLKLTGGYAASNTAVNFSVNVLRADGATSLASAVDDHGQGQPKPVSLLVPLAASDSGTHLLVLVKDAPKNVSLPGVDVKSQYSLLASIETDADANEPNDTTPTPVALTASGAQLVGGTTGYLSTTNDVDRYSIAVPAASAPRKILYLHLTAPAKATLPYRLSYTLLDPANSPVSEGVVQSAVIAADLATARLTLPAGGTYTLVVQGYHSTNVPGPVAGDPAQQYTLAVQLLDQVDAHEPNDTIAAPTVQAVASPGSAAQSFTGRLETVADEDWYGLDLAASAAPTRLHYWFKPTAPAGRFPPLPGLASRQVRVFTQVTNGALTQAQLVTACTTDRTVCPKEDDVSPTVLAGVNGFCNASPPQCLWSERNEETVQFADLHNFEGVIPVPPHAATARYFVVVRDGMQVWADDKDYTLRVAWEADADEAGRYSGSVEQTTPVALFDDTPTSGAFPSPPGGATVLTGTIATGHGRLRNLDPFATGEGVRANDDYDAVATDVDRYQLNLPAQDPAAGPLDRTWELEWKVDRAPDGGQQHELALEVTFCDGDNLDGGQCTPVDRVESGGRLVLSYSDQDLAGWHTSAGGYQPIYDRVGTAASDTTTARAYGCFCFEPRFVKGQKVFLNVVGLDRTGYAEVPYQLKTAMTAYPKSYLTTTGATESCPAPVAIDGGAGITDAGYLQGCKFTQQ